MGNRDRRRLAGDGRAAGTIAGLKRGAFARILEEVTDAARRWPEIAADVGIPGDTIDLIRANQRLELPLD